jgi:polysaccharide biosynthesis transport protein
MNEPIPFQGSDRATVSAQFFSRMQRYKSLLKRRWWILLITLGIAVGAQTYRASLTPLAYVSRAQMIVGNRTPLPDANASTYDENFVGTTIALLKGNLLTTRTREALKEQYPNAPREPILLDASLAHRTSIFLLQARGSNPRYTQDYLNTLMQEFLRYRQEIRGQSSEETLRSVTTQLREAQAQIANAQTELVAFKKRHNVISVEEEVKSTALRLSQLQNSLSDADRELRLLNALQSMPSGVAAGSKNDGALSQLTDYDRVRQTLAVLEAQRREMADVLKPKHPKMVAIEQQITSHKKLLEVHQQQNAEQLARRRLDLEKRMATLQTVIREETDKASLASARMAEYETLKTRLTSAESLYTRISTMVDQVKIGKEVPVETVSVLEPASVAKADNSGFTKNIVIGCFIGLVFGIGLLFLFDRFDDRPVSFTELQEHFDELILGQIPEDATRARDRKLLPLTANDTRYAYAEAHRNLRSSLIFMAIDGARPRTIVVTSAVPGEGKSTVAVNLAITMAFAGSRVLLIDADMRKGTVHEYFEIGNDPGLAEVLSGETKWQDVIQQTHVPNLTVLPRGNYPANPGELLLAGADGLIKEVNQHFDFVLFDSAPVLAADDTASLAPKADGTLFVIRAAYTSARLARNALDLLYQRQVNVMGIVFNSVETNSREYYYFKYPEYYSKRVVTS